MHLTRQVYYMLILHHPQTPPLICVQIVLLDQTPICFCLSSSCSMFAPISRQEAALIQQQAPPSYGQLIAQGVIPPVEDFPTENPNEVRA